MSRSGYSDDCENLELWRGAVDRALQGKRGQKFLRDLVAALDALPEKVLISDELQAEGAVCAIGSVGLLRGLDFDKIDPEDHDRLAKLFDIAPAMVKEIEFVNDDDFYRRETPEARFVRVRNWALSQIKQEDHA